MNKFFTALLAIFEFLFYTFFMVLLSDIDIKSELIKLLLHFVLLAIISIILYFLIRFILTKLKMNVKRYIYLIVVWNLIIGLVIPALMMVIIPNESLITLGVIVMVSTAYYGIFVNVLICFMNAFLSNRQKKIG